ncbi:MAG TPA: DUF1839 family protein [Rhodanobacteraceae bacterium]|nr:DUF1839 family protein [Rhodanobacteraceae bacterium]
MPAFAVIDLDPARYVRHAVHAESQTWPEKNCYVDVFIELVHALGCEPLALLPCVNAVDFVGDQWTFYKPPHDELRDLFGIEVQELTCWRPLIEHAEEHLAAGRLISTEADAWWLPDTSGTDYRSQHTKSTIILNRLDRGARQLDYFHNAGYFRLDGEDFARSFQLDQAPDPAFMPFYAELIRIDRLQRLPAADLRAASRTLLRRHVERMPAANPLPRFAARFARDLPDITEQGLAYYHAWAFATVRQLGSAAELAAAHLDWLADPALGDAAAAWRDISVGAKAFILKAARAVNARRALDAAPILDAWAASWQRAHAVLLERA